MPITDRNRWIALYVLCVGMLMIVLDATVVNVALPTIQDDLGSDRWHHVAFLIGAGLVVTAIAVALTVLEPEQRAAEQLEGDSASERQAGREATDAAYSEAA